MDEAAIPPEAKASAHTRQASPLPSPAGRKRRSFRMSWRFWIVGGCLLVLLASLATSRAAVRFDMFVGYDGLIPQGRWLPITFEVYNEGDGFIGTVEVSPGQMTSGQDRVMRVELPKGTTKRFTIPVFASATWNPTWTARLLDERRRVRAEAEGQNLRRFNGAMLPVAAAISRYLPVLPETKSRQDNMRAVFGRLQPALVPDNPLAFDGLDTLYLNSEKGLELKASQIAALESWLHAGGHLIVAIEQPSHLTGAGAWLAQLLPCQVSGLGNANGHDALQQWVTGSRRINGKSYDFTIRVQRPSAGLAAFNPFFQLAIDPDFSAAPLQVAQVRRRDGTVLVGTEEQPLVLTARRGLGQLTVLTFTPELEPFRSWKNAPYFWAKAVDLAPELLAVEWPNRGSSRPIEAVFGAMIDSRQIRKLPVGWLLLLLVAYLLVIGPLDQYWLKKLNRQMLTWITFPAYVVFFSLLIYFIGYKLRAGETEWTELHVVDVIQHGPRQEIRGRTYGSIYSPVNARYAFANEVAAATFRGEFTGNYGNPESTRGRVEQQAEGFTSEVAVPVWTSQLFLSDWWRQQTASPVTLEVTPKEIRVANRLNRSLVAARLILGSQVLNLGEIPAGGTKAFPRTSLAGENLETAVRRQGNLFESAASARQQVFSGTERGRIDDWTNAVIAASFVGQMRSNRPERDQAFTTPRGFDLSDSLDSGQAVLLAWAPGVSLVAPLNRFPARRVHRDTVFRVIAPAPALTASLP